MTRAALPTDKKLRKQFPVGTGVLDYFPDALAAVAYVSYVGNAQHNGPDAPLHWSRGKSDDHEDTVIRHYLERGGFDVDKTRHSAKLVWRSLAILQLEIEADRAAGKPGLCEDDVTLAATSVHQQIDKLEAAGVTVEQHMNRDLPVNATRPWPSAAELRAIKAKD